MLKAVKNSGDARRTIAGGTNFPESTSCAKVTVVPSIRTLPREEHAWARDGSGTEQQSASANPDQQIPTITRVFTF
jgi:hypothetical protein